MVRRALPSDDHVGMCRPLIGVWFSDTFGLNWAMGPVTHFAKTNKKICVLYVIKYRPFDV